LTYPIMVQPKVRGFRAVMRPTIDSFELVKGSGTLYRHDGIISHFKALLGVNSHVLDGILYDPANNFLPVVNTVPTTLKYYAFDCIPLADWNKQDCKLEYEARLKLLHSTLNEKVADYTKIIDVRTDIAETPKAIKDIYKEYLNMGYSGVILRSMNGLYKFGKADTSDGIIYKLESRKN
jgi:hypothetical protein